MTHRTEEAIRDILQEFIEYRLSVFVGKPENPETRLRIVETASMASCEFDMRLQITGEA